jgi:catalase
MKGDKKKGETKKQAPVAGAPVSDNENVMTAGPHGPMLL